jgi:hypothetical protein
MKNKRLRNYPDRKQTDTQPIRDKEEIARNPDNKIDQDFNGYPHGPAKDETIKPRTTAQKETADVDNKDGEKRTPKRRKTVTDEQQSDGSAKAFDDK